MFQCRMINFENLKNLLSWHLIRPHLCTLAVALSFTSSWRAPREAFRYGGLTTMLITTVATVLVALPVTLLQLSVGQLSQQDAVGIWRAVPFFKGVGYMRLLISFIGAGYSVVYIAMSLSYIAYTLSNSTSVLECSELIETPVGEIELISNSSTCPDVTFLVPVGSQPEYYVAMAFIIIVIWTLFPFLLYNPVKLMKRIFYAFGFLVILLGIIIASCIGNKENLAWFNGRGDWSNFVHPKIWYSALVQALISNQLAGGYLFSSGDSIYANVNIKWTTIIFVGANIMAGWTGVLFWFAIAGDGEKITNNAAVLLQIYKVAGDKDLTAVWPVLTYAMLSISGIITVLTLLYPLYDRFRRVGGHKWRHLSVGSSAIGAAGAITIFTIGHPVLVLLEDIIVPLMITIATVLEITAFVFVYGWKVLVEDIEFLIGSKLPIPWVWGWCASLGILVPVTLWWVIAIFVKGSDWTEAPWEPIGVVTSATTALVLLLVFATISVLKQVHYDFLGKLKSSFRPSRHWGPRDPIAHHYWLARRDGGDQNATRVRFQRRHLGQHTGTHFSTRMQYEQNELATKRRSYSDDLLLINRRNYVTKSFPIVRRRSKSLDSETIRQLKLQNKDRRLIDGLAMVDSIFFVHEKNNNVIRSDIKKDLA